jgi:hypothetical protein
MISQGRKVNDGQKMLVSLAQDRKVPTALLTTNELYLSALSCPELPNMVLSTVFHLPADMDELPMEILESFWSSVQVG